MAKDFVSAEVEHPFLSVHKIIPCQCHTLTIGTARPQACDLLNEVPLLFLCRFMLVTVFLSLKGLYPCNKNRPNRHHAL